MDLTLFGSDEEKVIKSLVEIEAHTSGKTVEESLFLVVNELLLGVDLELQFDDFLSLKLVLHEVPVGDSSIGRDGVEGEVLGVGVIVPFDLPDRVGMLGGSNRGLVDWLVVALEPDVEDHDGTVVATGRDECWARGVEVKAHNTRLGGEGVLGPCGVLDREAADQTGRLLQEVIGTVRDGEKILIPGVPAHAGDVLLAGLFGGETPKRKHGALNGVIGIFSLVLVIIPVVLKLLFLGVLDDHALHNFESGGHGSGEERVFLVNLDDLGLGILAFVLVGLFHLSTTLILESVHVGIEDHPLGGLNRVHGDAGRVSLDTFLSQRKVLSLRGSLLVEELVSQRDFLCLNVSRD